MKHYIREIPAPSQNPPIQEQYDVVVVGGGGAGLAAAVSALQSGAERVIIVEKTDILGGDTNVNGGIYNTPDEQMQAKTEDNHCAASPARYALEMNEGWFARKGLNPGQTIGGLSHLPPAR